MIKFLKKHKTFSSLLFVIVVVTFTSIIGYRSVYNNAKYAIGTTTRVAVSKGMKKETKYEFFVGGEKITASHTEIVRYAKDIVVPGGKYLVIYSEERPKLSNLLVNKPIVDTINLDSLNQLGVDKDEIEWYRI